MSAGSEEQQAMRVLALANRSTSALPSFIYSYIHLCMKPQTCCRCESVHFAGPAVAENPLELRRLLPAPGDLSATGSEVPATVPKLAFPRTLLPSRCNTLNWTELPCLKGAGKTIGRGSISREAGFISTRSHERQALIPRDLTRGRVSSPTRSRERRVLIA